jgi:hypothetical protein
LPSTPVAAVALSVWPSPIVVVSVTAVGTSSAMLIVMLLVTVLPTASVTR